MNTTRAASPPTRPALIAPAPRILALVPAFQEEAKIGSVVAAASEHLPVLVVDDGSTDGTASAAQTAGATVLVLERNAGKGAALRAGFGHALAEGYDAVVTLDADGQHLPEEIPAFLEAFARGAPDLVLGERDFRRMPLVRQLSNRIGRRTFSWALGRRIEDNQSGYRLVSRRLMQEMLAAREGGFEFEVEMIVRCARLGWAIAAVSISTIYADERSHISPLAHLARFARVVWRTRRTSRPPAPPSPVRIGVAAGLGALTGLA